jgi:hypothetical protein
MRSCLQVRADDIGQVAVDEPLHGSGDRVRGIEVDEQVVHVRPRAVGRDQVVEGHAAEVAHPGRATG